MAVLAVAASVIDAATSAPAIKPAWLWKRNIEPPILLLARRQNRARYDDVRQTPARRRPQRSLLIDKSSNPVDSGGKIGPVARPPEVLAKRASKDARPGFVAPTEIGLSRFRHLKFQ